MIRDSLFPNTPADLKNHTVIILTTEASNALSTGSVIKLKANHTYQKRTKDQTAETKPAPAPTNPATSINSRQFNLAITPSFQPT